VYHCRAEALAAAAESSDAGQQNKDETDSGNVSTVTQVYTYEHSSQSICTDIAVQTIDIKIQCMFLETYVH